jgi:hypothetical protein
MILPQLQGSCPHNSFFIYAAADAVYFDLYGVPLINSVLRNTCHGCHVHIYDPRPDQIDWVKSQPRASVSWETTAPNQFDSAVDFWSQTTLPEPYHGRRNKMLGMKQLEPQTIAVWIRKTYYACMRFVRLAEMVTQPSRLLAIDIDGLVRDSFAIKFPDDDKFDIYLYEKSKTDKKTGQSVKTGHLAGSIVFTEKPQAHAFMQDLANTIRANIEQDNIYWFLDQTSIDSIVPQYRRGLLPLDYIDWRMNPASAIWTAKGKRKELEVFINELKKYTF